MAARDKPELPAEAAGRVLVLHPFPKSGGDGGSRSPEARLEEAVGLAQAIRLTVADAIAVPLVKPRPATLMGSGKVEELAARLRADPVELVVIDGALSPGQQRNLEKAWATKVIDRTGLILEIFGDRARTAEGSLQVELAALEYQRTRLVRSWTHLERQRGGFGFLGGPGESQLEMDRRLIGERIVKIKRELEDVKRTRQLHRDNRARVPYPVVALVGYTNAGKSTLFNTLTGSDAFAANLLFATLDPAMRALTLPSGRKVILSDTVGFISELPHQLVAAFRATLEEVLAAEIVLVVGDVSHSDRDAQRQDVRQVLAELGADLDKAVAGRTGIEVWNKIDRLTPEDRARLIKQAGRRQLTAAVSAATGEGCAALIAAIDQALAGGRRRLTITLSAGDGATLAWLHRHGEVLAAEAEPDGQVLVVEARLDPPDVERLRRLPVLAVAEQPQPAPGRLAALP